MLYKGYPKCLNNHLLDILSSDIVEESVKYSALRFSHHSDEITLHKSDMRGNLAFVRFENTFMNDLLYSRKTDRVLFRISYERTFIIGPLADLFPGRLMALKLLYSEK